MKEFKSCVSATNLVRHRNYISMLALAAIAFNCEAWNIEDQMISLGLTKDYDESKECYKLCYGNEELKTQKGENLRDSLYNCEKIIQYAWEKGGDGLNKLKNTVENQCNEKDLKSPAIQNGLTILWAATEYFKESIQQFDDKTVDKVIADAAKAFGFERYKAKTLEYDIKWYLNNEKWNLFRWFNNVKEDSEYDEKDIAIKSSRHIYCYSHDNYKKLKDNKSKNLKVILDYAEWQNFSSEEQKELIRRQVNDEIEERSVTFTMSDFNKLYRGGGEFTFPYGVTDVTDEVLNKLKVLKIKINFEITWGRGTIALLDELIEKGVNIVQIKLKVENINAHNNVENIISSCDKNGTKSYTTTNDAAETGFKTNVYDPYYNIKNIMSTRDKNTTKFYITVNDVDLELDENLDFKCCNYNDYTKIPGEYNFILKKIKTIYYDINGTVGNFKKFKSLKVESEYKDKLIARVDGDVVNIKCKKLSINDDDVLCTCIKDDYFKIRKKWGDILLNEIDSIYYDIDTPDNYFTEFMLYKKQDNQCEFSHKLVARINGEKVTINADKDHNLIVEYRTCNNIRIDHPVLKGSKIHYQITADKCNIAEFKNLKIRYGDNVKLRIGKGSKSPVINIAVDENQNLMCNYNDYIKIPGEYKVILQEIKTIYYDIKDETDFKNFKELKVNSEYKDKLIARINEKKVDINVYSLGMRYQQYYTCEYSEYTKIPGEYNFILEGISAIYYDIDGSKKNFEKFIDLIVKPEYKNKLTACINGNGVDIDVDKDGNLKLSLEYNDFHKIENAIDPYFKNAKVYNAEVYFDSYDDLRTVIAKIYDKDVNSLTEDEIFKGMKHFKEEKKLTNVAFHLGKDDIEFFKTSDSIKLPKYVSKIQHGAKQEISRLGLPIRIEIAEDESNVELFFELENTKLEKDSSKNLKVKLYLKNQEIFIIKEADGSTYYECNYDKYRNILQYADYKVLLPKLGLNFDSCDELKKAYNDFKKTVVEANKELKLGNINVISQWLNELKKEKLVKSVKINFASSDVKSYTYSKKAAIEIPIYVTYMWPFNLTADDNITNLTIWPKDLDLGCINEKFLSGTNISTIYVPSSRYKKYTKDEGDGIKTLSKFKNKNGDIVEVKPIAERSKLKNKN